MIRLLPGDCRSVLATLPADSVHCVVDIADAIRYSRGMNDGRIKKGQRLSPATEFKPGQAVGQGDDRRIRCAYSLCHGRRWREGRYRAQ